LRLDLPSPISTCCPNPPAIGPDVAGGGVAVAKAGAGQRLLFPDTRPVEAK
jgi:hypothetical protein